MTHGAYVRKTEEAHLVLFSQLPPQLMLSPVIQKQPMLQRPFGGNSTICSMSNKTLASYPVNNAKT